MPVAISPATADDLGDALPLFAGYQVFYTGAARDDAHNRQYLNRLVGGGAGLILLARDEGTGEAVGLANLFWIFSSTVAEDRVLLGDLFVAEHARGKDVGWELIQAARAVAHEWGSPTLTWQTALDNRTAQRLYERTGAERSAWFEYELPSADAASG